MTSESSLSLSEGSVEGSTCVSVGVNEVPLVNGRFNGVEEVGRYITLLAGRPKY